MLIRIKMCRYQDQYVDGMKVVQYDSSTRCVSNPLRNARVKYKYIIVRSNRDIEARTLYLVKPNESRHTIIIASSIKNTFLAKTPHPVYMSCVLRVCVHRRQIRVYKDRHATRMRIYLCTCF